MNKYEKCCWCSREPDLHCHISWGYHTDWKQLEKDYEEKK